MKLSAKGTKDANDLGGVPRPEPGRYLAYISHWDESFQEKDADDAVVCSFSVIGGTVPGQQGRVLRKYFNLTDKQGKDTTDRILRVAMVAGVVKPDEEVNRDLTGEMLGKLVVIEVEPHEYNNRDGKLVKTVQLANFGYAVWKPHDQAVADVIAALDDRAKAVLAKGGVAVDPPPAKSAAADGWGDVL